MSRKKIIVISLVVAGLVAVVLELIVFSNKSEKQISSPVDSAQVTEEKKEEFSSWRPAPKNVVVPEANSSAPADVAKPLSVTPAAPGSSSSQRDFDISIAHDKFIPDKIIAKLKDNIVISFTATDKDYYFTQPDYGFNELIKKGTTKKVGLGLTATGDFLFYCSACGGPEKGPVGHLIVVE